MCYERIVDTGAGSTDYILSLGNQNSMWNNTSMPDTEGCVCDGQLSGSDFEPESQGPVAANF